MEPTIVKTLRLLRESKEALTAEEISDRIGEDTNSVRRVLLDMMKRGIIREIGSSYVYQRTPSNEEFAKRFLGIYDRLKGRPKIELIVRGLISSGIYLAPEGKLRIRDIFFGGWEYEPYLFHLGTLQRIIEEEGFGGEELNFFIDEEIKNGYMAKIEFHIGSKEEIKIRAPVCIGIWHHYLTVLRRLEFYYSGLLREKEFELVIVYVGKVFEELSSICTYRTMTPEEVEELKREFLERWKNLGWAIRREDYVIGQYPPEIIKEAITYLDKERQDIKRRLSNEIIRFWYGVRW